jgi:hypothetical protein
LAERSWEEISQEIIEVWEQSRSNWHLPQLPAPVCGPANDGQFPFVNYRINIDDGILNQGSRYLENLFDHLIVHYIFCPRSLEMSAALALSASQGMKNGSAIGSRNASMARRIVNIFSDIVVDSFRLERSNDDQEKVLLGWKNFAKKDISHMDQVVLGFLAEYWSAPLPRCDRPETDQLLQVYSPGVRDKGLWKRQCQETARILEALEPGLLGRGQVRAAEILNGNADSVPLAGLAKDLEPALYRRALEILGLKWDLKRWYRDQSCTIEIKHSSKARWDYYPSGFVKWQPTDPPATLDVSYSLSLSPKLVPGVTTYRREQESCQMAPGREAVPDLLIVLDSSKSMEGHSLNTKTHKATLAAFKACQYAHQQGAEVAAINFSDRYLVQPWTRNLGAVEDTLVEYFCGRTNIPGDAILEHARIKKGCLILCITDTHIQNLYLEWEHLKKASELGKFVLFCIDQAGRDRQVGDALGTLGKVYYINRLDDLIMLVVEAAEQAYQVGESFISQE